MTYKEWGDELPYISVKDSAWEMYTDWTTDRESIEQWTREAGTRILALDETHIAYEKLLIEELNEFAGLTFAHGFQSTRVEAGKECRKQIEEARAALARPLAEGEKE